MRIKEQETRLTLQEHDDDKDDDDDDDDFAKFQIRDWIFVNAITQSGYYICHQV